MSDVENRSIKVLLVDDQELVRTGLRGILRPRFGFDIVGELDDGEQIVETTQRLRPHVVVMDVRMPKVDGVTATRLLSGVPGSPPVLVLTTFEDEEVLAGALRAGAAGFLLKGVPAEDLQRAVKAVAAGDSWLEPGVTAGVLAKYREGVPPASALVLALARRSSDSRVADLVAGCATGLLLAARVDVKRDRGGAA